jgi:hypothetical protein
MHGTALAGTQRARRTSAGNLWTRALKNGLTGNGAAGRGTHAPCGRSGLRCRRDGTRRRRFVHGTRPSLRHNHARSRRLRRACNGRWCSRPRRRHWSLRRGSGGRRRRSGRNRSRRWHQRARWSNSRRRIGCNRSRGSCGPFRGRRHNCGTRRGRWCNWSRRCRSRRRGWSCDRRGNCWLRRHWRRCRPQSRGNCFLLLRNGFQHVSGPGDVRQIDLGLDFFFAPQRARGPGRRRLRFGRAADVEPHFFRFILLERTGMGLLLRHTDER